MNLSSIERDILTIVKNLREPSSVTHIARSSRANLFTVKKVCQHLVNKGYVTVINGYRYSATNKKVKKIEKKKQSKHLKKRPSPKSKKDNNNELIKNIATQVAEEVSKQLQQKSFISKPTKIAIKTDFTPQIEDETKSLVSNLGEVGVKSEKQKATDKIEKSVKVLQNVKNNPKG